MRKSALVLAPMILAMLLACAVVLVVLNTPARAAFPGKNGKIAFTSSRGGDPDIYVMNPDGSGIQLLTVVPHRLW
jgi:hypothetical protein